MDAGNAAIPQGRKVHDPSEHDGQERGDEVIYADDASMIIDLDAIPPIARKLLNYGTLAGARDVKIHWEKVGIIARLKDHGALKQGYQTILTEKLSKRQEKY